MKGKIISKISIKTVWGSKPDAPRKGEPDTQWLMQVVGQANSFGTGSTDKGEWTKLIGAFQAINLETGEAYRSGTCFLPNVALDLVMGQLKMAETKAVSFGFKIGIVRDESSATNYVYVADPIYEVMEHDPLAPLLEKMKGTDAAAIEPPKEKAAGKGK